MTEQLTYEEWEEKYKPIVNPFSDVDPDDGDAFIFTDYDTTEEHEYLRDLTGSHKIWTKVSGENDSIVIIEGRHLVNRIGYYVTEIPYENQVNVTIDEGYEDLDMNDVASLEWILSKELNITDPNEEQKKLQASIRKVLKYLEYTV